MSKVLSFFLSVIMFLFPSLNIPKADVDTTAFKNDYANVFVHGLGGWGEKSPISLVMPYWGAGTGDLMDYLNARGFTCCSATVNPSASAWDRACELYAQITGTRVDYGEAHSKACHHARYGKRYLRPMVKNWSAENKINLFGHSFGGPTILEFTDLMANGSAAERAATPENKLSPLFKGGQADWIYSVTTLSSPTNGTTAYELKEVVPKEKDATIPERLIVGVCSIASIPPLDGRTDNDCAAYDMTIDGAKELNGKMKLPKNVYYFSVPTCASVIAKDGTCTAIEGTEPILVAAVERMGIFTCTTPGGQKIGKDWLPNDGLVNTISAIAPFGAKTVSYDPDHIRAGGVWNVYPTYEGDHMALMGGMVYTKDVRPMFVEMLTVLHTF